MDELIEQMKVTLANTFSFYLKAHNFHWNVEGSNFSELHGFFEGIYSDAWGAVDAIAEHIRNLEAYAPGSLGRFRELSQISDENNIPDGHGMITKLEADNKKVIESLKLAQKQAETQGAVGIANFYQDRIDIHEKHGWMMRAYTKR
jgi:starvation-inducible DNA-binding protein